jgi:hypothetical protein
MYFEILGEITDVETFATGSTTESSQGCGGCTVEAAGESVRA